MSLSDMVNEINCKEDLIKFIKDLKLDFKINKDSWENINLEDYFEAMSSWIEDIDGWERNCKIDISKMSPWQLFGHILLASAIYE